MVDEAADCRWVAQDDAELDVVAQGPVREVGAAEQGGMPVGGDQFRVQDAACGGFCPVPDTELVPEGGEGLERRGGFLQQEVDVDVPCHGLAQPSHDLGDAVGGEAGELDQTRVGSYVIAAHTPLSEPPPQAELPFADATARREPFERLVSRRLWAGVWSAQQAAERSVREDTLYDFELYAPAGLSANLCEALVRIAGDEYRPYELNFAWSGELPMEQATPPVRLHKRLLPALEEGAKDLRTRLGQRDVVVHGTVVRLDRSLPYGPGEVTVLGNVEGEEHRRPRRYRVTLREQDYSQAAFAHDRGHEVTVRGDLTVSGGHTRLEPVTVFTVRHVAD